MAKPNDPKDSEFKFDVATLQWDVIDKYFSYDTQVLVKHHISSYNLFMKEGIPKIFRDENPISLEFKDSDSERRNVSDAPILYKCKLYLGGKTGTSVYFGKPIIYDYSDDVPMEDSEFKHYMYPNEARLRNMTYATTIRIDVDVEMTYPNLETDQTRDNYQPFITKSFTIPKVRLGKLPVMVQSDFCILKGLAPDARYYMGECRNDPGGYFIIDGKEKLIICQEKFADNLINVRVLGVEGETSGKVFTHSADIRTVSEDPSKPVRTLSIRVQAPSPSFTHGNIVVFIPNVRSPVPLFIVMRALGIESDKSILEHCLYDLESNQQLLELFVPSVHDANRIFTQQQALAFIGMLTKLGNDKNATPEKTIICAHEILTDYFLPQVGDMNYQHKAYMLGYIVNKLIRVVAKIDLPTDRDSFLNKRVDTSGMLLYDLFREYYKKQVKIIRQSIDKMYYYEDTGKYQGAGFLNMIIGDTYHTHFKELELERGILRAFKGRWGDTTQTKRIGLVQDVNRLSYNSFISHLRKINLELGSETLVKPRLLHSSQWGMIDPVDVPDGANTGLHKHLSLIAHITSGCSAQPVINWLRDYNFVRFIDECYPIQLFQLTKVIINGTLWAVTNKPVELVQTFKFCRRVAIIPVFISISWRYSVNEIHIFTDAGRLCRPLFYNDSGTLEVDLESSGDPSTEPMFNPIRKSPLLPTPSYIRMMARKPTEVKTWTWSDLVSGTLKKRIDDFNYENYEFYQMDELYGMEDAKQDEPETEDKTRTTPSRGLFARLKNNQAIVEYLDQSETESSVISMDIELTPSELKTRNELAKKDKTHAQNASTFTHFEIHPSLILGVMGNQVAFVENNQFPRDAFGCGQAKQTASLYHTNFFSRIDKMSMVINNGQIPLVKSRLLEYINNEQHPNGENAIVAIACYNGYNVEDSILFNEASIKRGLFNITYYNMYEDCEEDDPEPGSDAKSFFSNSLSSSVRGVNSEHDYRNLDATGIIKENTKLNEKMVVIGKLKRCDKSSGASGSGDAEFYTVPTVAKKGQLGYVDRTYMTEGMKGTRIAKVRVREHRYPAVGDKFCSRCGQKGTVGFIVPERDMPFTADGIRPDLIVNPHAFPSRLTVGQLIETLVGKACLFTGTFGDCTAFLKTDPLTRGKTFGNILTHHGYHSSGNQVLYNGMTGEQIESDIFIGPTYYMRLKQMVKDKINYRRTGPNTALTRQPVQGRANDGGLRVGEMERDSVISHGISRFLQESMMKRGDQYYLAICNTTGMIAVYNESQDLFISPLADGPIKYAGNMSELKSAQVINVTRHGRSFSVVHIPYSLKLLIQELQVLNVQMRIITDANIDSIESMAASKNIEMLMEPGADLATVGMETARTLGVENIKSNMFSHLKHSIDDEFGNGDGNNDDTDINDNDDTDDNDDENDDSVSIATNPNKKQDNTHKLKNKNKRTRNSLSTDFPDTLGLPSSESIKVVENHGWTLLPELSDRYGETFASIVTNESGKPTEYWHTVKREGKYPDRYPDGWLPGPKNKWESSRPLEIEDKVDALKRFPPPTRNNLKVAQEYILQFKSDKYPKIPFLFNKATSSDAANDFTNSATGMVLGPGFDTDKNEMFEGDSVAVLHSQLINVGKQISAIELSIQQIDQRSTNEDGVKNYTKEDTKELERLVRQLVSLQSNKDRLTKQLSDEQLVKSITSNIVSSNSDTTPGSVIYSPYTSTSPPYTSSSPVSPMMQPVMTAMPMQMPMQMPMPMQPMMVPVQMPSTTNQVNQVVKSQPDTNSNPDNTSGSSDSSTTKKIILNT
jgi:DNA-directed RNA polymerase II subunit RPB2